MSGEFKKRLNNRDLLCNAAAGAAAGKFFVEFYSFGLGFLFSS